VLAYSSGWVHVKEMRMVDVLSHIMKQIADFQGLSEIDEVRRYETAELELDDFDRSSKFIFENG